MSWLDFAMLAAVVLCVVFATFAYKTFLKPPKIEWYPIDSEYVVYLSADDDNGKQEVA